MNGNPIYTILIGSQWRFPCPNSASNYTLCCIQKVKPETVSHFMWIKLLPSNELKIHGNKYELQEGLRGIQHWMWGIGKLSKEYRTNVTMVSKTQTPIHWIDSFKDCLYHSFGVRYYPLSVSSNTTYKPLMILGTPFKIKSNSKPRYISLMIW